MPAAPQAAIRRDGALQGRRGLSKARQPAKSERDVRNCCAGARRDGRYRPACQPQIAGGCRGNGKAVIDTRALHRAARRLVASALAEDLGDRGDITTLALNASRQQSTAVIIAKQEGIVCGLDIVKLVFQRVDPAVIVEAAVKDGDRVGLLQPFLQLSGPSQSILVAERICLNFVGRLSGIATCTRQFVDAILGTKARILDTRKTTPGWRLLEKYAVRCGGGDNHRIGLYDMFLIKENHIAAAGGMRHAVDRCRRYMQAHNFQVEIEVETQNSDDVREALSLDVDRIMLDNMSLAEMRQSVLLVHGRIPLEASGNVTLATVRDIAETGVDFISVGSLTHSAKALDISLLLRS
ncbi:carboxylating nicotinate-nucleotide diphosphorylase [candidate division KSB1 bacterium]|nr:MAG: carboxylating nicotinate-nucleotide diphosphorylase [candidate division KSB1 bacterium]